ncbi:MAG: hypothetical protein OMM_05458 [Candidatus Magnetoglobus multicellularis str. Araruama]|uniref:Carboxypeptidase regulatory-like domain-containing protein n=1 Tax=Candidatus Magnetoglobus multicellularis str. Araruama TaxID=890399 RepID=A0A1V1NW67_9BACT|nr:MAG: hypothetical protein OMM_05458 [Candidatus Magnetoglobus multicellularis str. Araruama]
MIYADHYLTQYYDQQRTSESAILVNTLDHIEINLTLNPGGSISGTVYKDEKPASGIIVVAYSNQLDAMRGSISQEDGTYRIDGLDFVNDYEIYASIESGSAPFYYNKNQTTRNRQAASKVSVEKGIDPSGINIYLSKLERISGRVINQSGIPIEGIWVSAWSTKAQAGFGIFTKEDGSYDITDLPAQADYLISVEPDIMSFYMPQQKKNISSNSDAINFIITKGLSLTGDVHDIKNYAITGAGIELKSSDFSRWTISNTKGEFTINGIPEANDYILSVYSPEKASFIPHIETELSIETNISKSIIMKYGYAISGNVYDQDGPVSNITISAWSKSLDYYGQTISDQNGHYIIKNLPQAFDYELSIDSPLYERDQQLNIAAGSVANFILSKGGSISGHVQTESGGLPGVVVKITSQSMHIEVVGLTDDNGYYMVNALKTKDRQGNAISDYFVSIYPQNYISQTQGPIMPGKSANFICTNVDFESAKTLFQFF